MPDTNNVEQDSGVNYKAGKKTQQDQVKQGCAHASSRGEKLGIEYDAAPEGTDQCADDPVFSLTEHVGGIRLYALKGCDDRVERLPAHAADIVQNHAEPYGNDRPDNALSGKGKFG